MNAHKNARAMPFGRAVMVRRVLEEVWTVAAVASAFEVSTRTVSKWLARFHRVGHRITGDRPHGSDGAGWSSCMWRSTTSRGPPTSRSCPTRSAPVGHRLPGPRPALVQKPRYPVERAMIDNGSGYVSRLFRKACRMLRLRHLRTRPYTPKINGKAEPVIQTLLRERPMFCRTAAPTPAPPTCPGGCATTTTSDPMLASPLDHRSPGSRRSPEPRPRKSDLALDSSRTGSQRLPILFFACPAQQNTGIQSGDVARVGGGDRP
jgi:hypothetical protein